MDGVVAVLQCCHLDLTTNGGCRHNDASFFSSRISVSSTEASPVCPSLKMIPALSSPASLLDANEDSPQMDVCLNLNALQSAVRRS